MAMQEARRRRRRRRRGIRREGEGNMGGDSTVAGGLDKWKVRRCSEKCSSSSLREFVAESVVETAAACWEQQAAAVAAAAAVPTLLVRCPPAIDLRATPDYSQVYSHSLPALPARCWEGPKKSLTKPFVTAHRLLINYKTDPRRHVRVSMYVDVNTVAVGLNAGENKTLPQKPKLPAHA